MDALSLLKSRNSAAKLVGPGPTDEELTEVFAAATRAPDHGRLRPWRFLVISGANLMALGDLFADAALRREPTLGEPELERFRQQPLRAPLIVVVISCLQDHPKIPRIEQQMSAACAAHGILLAAEALGYAGIWRTGANAFDAHVMAGLELSANEEIAGFLYIGSRDGRGKPLPALESADFVKVWRQ
ncbi:nitroreductase [Zhongshania sp.]|uniref:nitroreductase family protein n=1 Tax=Zhongshania sp. TaxID=1971902 RepID=UPI003561CEDE